MVAVVASCEPQIVLNTAHATVEEASKLPGRRLSHLFADTNKWSLIPAL
jgi:hypothetical protein